MESENVAIVRRVFDLFNRLDPDPEIRGSSREFVELIDLFDPEIEFIQPVVQVDADVFRGREALREVWDEWLTVWQEHRSQIVEIAERGDSLLVLSHDTFKGRDGLEAAVHGGAMFTLGGGRIVRMWSFLDHTTARHAFAEHTDS